MTDDEIVNMVFNESFAHYFNEYGGQELGYNTKDDRSMWRNHAARLNMHSTWHEPWRLDVEAARYVAQNWKPE